MIRGNTRAMIHLVNVGSCCWGWTFTGIGFVFSADGVGKLNLSWRLVSTWSSFWYRELCGCGSEGLLLVELLLSISREMVFSLAHEK